MQIKTLFSLRLGSYTIPITETVVVTWAVMALIILGSLWWRRRLEKLPRGKQIFLEWVVDFCDKFCKEQLGKFGRVFADYIGTLFIFILVMNLVPVISPVSGFGFVAPFEVKMPTRDINVTAALAVTTIVMCIVTGIATLGLGGWLKTLVEPFPFMLPFNLLDYVTKPLSLALRLFGNMLACLVIIALVEAVFPLVLPIPVSVFFDWFDGTLQAVIFTFLTLIYLSEMIPIQELSVKND